MGIIDGSLFRRLICLNLWCLLLGGGVTVVVAEDEKKVIHRQLNQTPTWAVAAVCTFFIVVSVLLEKVLHKVGTVGFYFFGFMLNLCTFCCLCWIWGFIRDGFSLICEKELSLSLRFWVYVYVWIVNLSWSEHVLDLGSMGSAQESSSRCLGEDQIR